MKNKDLLYKSQTYGSLVRQMSSLQDAYLAGYKFKRQTRTKRPSEDAKLWNDLIDHSVAMPICQYVVNTINDTVFYTAPQRTIRFADPVSGKEIDNGGGVGPFMDWYESFLIDASLNHESFDSFMECVADQASIFGHTWVFVDKDQQDELGRPYLVNVSPLDVWDYQLNLYRGRYLLQHVKVKEFECDDYVQFKIYRLGTVNTPSTWETWQVQKDTANMNPDGEATFVDRGELPAGMTIPAVIVINKKDPRRVDIGVPDIEAAAETQREHYKLECEAYQSIQFAKTVIRADTNIKVPAGAGAIVRGEEGCIEVFPVDIPDVDKIRAQQESILANLEISTGIAGLRSTKMSAESGVSIVAQRQNLYRVASAKARSLEVAEVLIWSLAARFMNVRWAGIVEYPRDYDKHDTTYRLAIFKEANMLAGSNKIIKGLINEGLVSMMVPAHEIPDYLEMLHEQVDSDAVYHEQEEQEEVYTRDLGTDLPDEEIPDEPTKDGGYGALGTPITYTGQSSYNPVADQLVGLAQGR